MSERIQVIITKDNKVLTVQSVSEHGRRENFFITGKAKESEKACDAALREVKEQLGLDCNITLSFSREIVGGLKTFLIDIGEKAIDLNCDIDRVKSANPSFKPVGLNWSPLSPGGFRDLETQYIKLLLEESYKNSYEAPWIDTIKNSYFASKTGRNKIDRLFQRLNRDKMDNEVHITNKLLSILIALGVGLLFNYFFLWKSIGISGLIYTTVVIFAAIYGVRNVVTFSKPLSYIFLVPTLLLALSFSIFNNTVLRSLNILVIPILIGAYLLSIRYKGISAINISFIGNLINYMSKKALSISPKFFVFTKEVFSNKVMTRENKALKSIIIGLLISAPVLMVVLVLLSEADMMFNYYLKNIGEIFEQVGLGELIGRSIIIGIVTLYMFGAMWSLRYNEENSSKEITINRFLEPVTIITLITVINIAYLAFTLIQSSYLYGGGISRLPEGFSYAEYARRGFFELILVTIINFFILLTSMGFTKKYSNIISRVLEVSYSLLIAFTFNMLVSASYKMHLYEKAYGFTQLRIFVQAFMLLLGIILVIVLIGIWNKRVQIFKYAVIATIIIYVGLNYINVDKVIAKENIQRYTETNKIDINYLKTLSYDAAPELIKLLEADEYFVRGEIDRHFKEIGIALDKTDYRWYQYNYYRHYLNRL